MRGNWDEEKEGERIGKEREIKTGGVEIERERKEGC